MKSKKEKLTPLPKLLKQTETKVNEYIRKRDAGNPCISCGSDKGNQAGHYFAVKRSTVLRYHPVNINLQCAYCNCYCHGNEAFYRIGLVQKWGEETVKSLEQQATTQRIYKWSRAELLDIQQQIKQGRFGEIHQPLNNQTLAHS